MNILVVGNCHVHQIVESLEFITSAKVNFIRDPLILKVQKEKLDDANVIVDAADYIGIVSSFWDDFLFLFPNAVDKCKMIPHIRSSAFHPDIIEISKNGKRLESVMEVSHSRLIVYGFLNGLSISEVSSLFVSDVFKELGYFNEWEKDLSWARYQSSITGWDVEKLYDKWKASGCFVHTPNHPKLHVLSHLALEFAKNCNIDIRFAEVRDVLVDRAASHAIWPVYPHISDIFDVHGSFCFKPSSRGKNIFQDKNITIDLESFIKISYDFYEDNSLSVDDIEKSVLLDFEKITFHLKKGRSKNNSNPYRNLPAYCFWKKAVAQVGMSDVDPVVRSKFKIYPDSKVATAGSCFAQHISRALLKSNFNYYVSEKAPLELDDVTAQERNYGVFSARFGNIYSTSQLLQLFNRAYNKFSPKLTYLRLPNGKYVDPFRPYIEPDGFSSIEEVAVSASEHLAYVRTMFEESDFFVFTLGLTEGWRSKLDGAVLPVAPGVVTTEIVDDDFEFFNMNCDEVVSDLIRFVELLRCVNSKLKIILTVSPVPLIATYEDKHALVSTTYSKSVLRVAADVIERKFDNVMYFPSYEIITGNFNKGSYYEEDLRSVRPSGVEHVMKLFMKHCVSKNPVVFDEHLGAKINSSKVICDEENIEK